MLDLLTARLRVAGAVMAPPASPIDLAMLEQRLQHAGFPGLPGDYAEFLTYCDGMWWNGTVFYGNHLLQAETESGDTPDLLTANQNATLSGKWPGQLLIGAAEMESYLYHPATGIYAMHDTLVGDVFHSFPHFGALLAFLAAENGLN